MGSYVNMNPDLYDFVLHKRRTNDTGKTKLRSLWNMLKFFYITLGNRTKGTKNEQREINKKIV